MVDLELIERVKDFVAEETGSRRSRISNKSRISEDLGVDGDDGADLMNAFATLFKVDISEFEFDLHFSPEAAFNPFYFLWAACFDRSPLKSVPITIEDLTLAAQTGKWRSSNLIPTTP